MEPAGLHIKGWLDPSSPGRRRGVGFSPAAATRHLGAPAAGPGERSKGHPRRGGEGRAWGVTANTVARRRPGRGGGQKRALQLPRGYKSGQAEIMEGSCHPQPQEAVEAWLDDHGDFTRSYFVRKATR